MKRAKLVRVLQQPTAARERQTFEFGEGCHVRYGGAEKRSRPGLFHWRMPGQPAGCEDRYRCYGTFRRRFRKSCWGWCILASGWLARPTTSWGS